MRCLTVRWCSCSEARAKVADRSLQGTALFIYHWNPSPPPYTQLPIPYYILFLFFFLFFLFPPPQLYCRNGHDYGRKSSPSRCCHRYGSGPRRCIRRCQVHCHHTKRSARGVTTSPLSLFFDAFFLIFSKKQEKNIGKNKD